MDLHKITVLPHSHFIKESMSRMDQLLTGLLQRVQHTSRCAGMGCRVLSHHAPNHHGAPSGFTGKEEDGGQKKCHETSCTESLLGRQGRK